MRVLHAMICLAALLASGCDTEETAAAENAAVDSAASAPPPEAILTTPPADIDAPPAEIGTDAGALAAPALGCSLRWRVTLAIYTGFQVPVAAEVRGCWSFDRVDLAVAPHCEKSRDSSPAAWAWDDTSPAHGSVASEKTQITACANRPDTNGPGYEYMAYRPDYAPAWRAIGGVPGITKYFAELYRNNDDFYLSAAWNAWYPLRTRYAPMVNLYGKYSQSNMYTSTYNAVYRACRASFAVGIYAGTGTAPFDMSQRRRALIDAMNACAHV